MIWYQPFWWSDGRQCPSFVFLSLERDERSRKKTKQRGMTTPMTTLQRFPYSRQSPECIRFACFSAALRSASNWYKVRAAASAGVLFLSLVARWNATLHNVQANSLQTAPQSKQNKEMHPLEFSRLIQCTAMKRILKNEAFILDRTKSIIRSVCRHKTLQNLHVFRFFSLSPQSFNHHVPSD